MSYYDKVIVLSCLISLLIAGSLILFNYPTYEFYIDNFQENDDSYSFNLVLDGEIPNNFAVNTYVNNHFVRKDQVDFIGRRVFPGVIFKKSLDQGENKIIFKIYSEEMSNEFFGSVAKPYEIYKVVNYEKN